MSEQSPSLCLLYRDRSLLDLLDLRDLTPLTSEAGTFTYTQDDYKADNQAKGYFSSFKEMCQTFQNELTYQNALAFLESRNLSVPGLSNLGVQDLKADVVFRLVDPIRYHIPGIPLNIEILLKSLRLPVTLKGDELSLPEEGDIETEGGSIALRLDPKELSVDPAWRHLLGKLPSLIECPVQLTIQKKKLIASIDLSSLPKGLKDFLNQTGLAKENKLILPLGSFFSTYPPAKPFFEPSGELKTRLSVSGLPRDVQQAIKNYKPKKEIEIGALEAGLDRLTSHFFLSSPFLFGQINDAKIQIQIPSRAEALVMSGHIPILELTLQIPGRETPVRLEDCRLDFYASLADQKIALNLMVGWVDGVQAISQGNLELELSPPWFPSENKGPVDFVSLLFEMMERGKTAISQDPTDEAFITLLHELTVQALAQWVQPDGDLSRYILSGEYVGDGQNRDALSVILDGDSENQELRAKLDGTPVLLNGFPSFFDPELVELQLFERIYLATGFPSLTGEVFLDGAHLVYRRGYDELKGRFSFSQGRFFGPSFGFNFEKGEIDGKLSIEEGLLEGKIDLMDLSLQVQLGAEKTLVRIQEGELILEKDLSDTANFFHRAHLKVKRLALYEDQNPAAQALAWLVEQAVIDLTLHTLKRDESGKLVIKLTGTIDYQGITALKAFHQLPQPIQALLKQLLSQSGQILLTIDSVLASAPPAPVPPLSPLIPAEKILEPISELNFDFFTGQATPADLLLKAIEILFRSDGGFLTFKQDRYHPNDYLRWAKIKNRFCRDWKKNPFVHKTQQGLKEGTIQGLTIFDGREGLYLSKTFDYYIPEDTKLALMVVHKKDDKQDAYGTIRNLEITFSKPIKVFLKLPCHSHPLPPALGLLHGFYVDVERNMIIPDLSPWPDHWFSKNTMELAWKATPEEIREKLIAAGYDQKIPVDLGILFDALSTYLEEAVIQKEKPLDEAITTTFKTVQSGPKLRRRSLLEKNRIETLQGSSIVNPQQIPPFHMETVLPKNQVINFGFATLTLEGVNGFRRVVADIDYANKRVTLDFPDIDRLIIRSGEQTLILEEGSARGIVIQKVGDQFTFEAASLGVRAIQYAVRDRSMMLESSSQNAFTHLHGSFKQGKSGRWGMSLAVDFDPADDSGIHIRKKDREHYIEIKEAQGVKGHLEANLNGKGNGESLALEDMHLVMQIPHRVNLNFGIKNLTATQEGGIHQKANGEKPGYEIGLLFENGTAEIFSAGAGKVTALFKGGFSLDTSRTLYISQELAQGVKADLSISGLKGKGRGIIELSDDKVSLIPEDKTKPLGLSADATGIISLHLPHSTGGIPLQAQIISNSDFHLVTAISSLLQFQFSPNSFSGEGNDFNPTLTFATIDSLHLQVNNGRIRGSLEAGGLKTYNTWNHLSGNIRLGKIDLAPGALSGFRPSGLVSVRLKDLSNRFNVEWNFGKPQEPVKADIYLVDPEKKNTISFQTPAPQK